MSTEKWCGQCQRYAEKPCFFLLEATECQRKRLQQIDEEQKEKKEDDDKVG